MAKFTPFLVACVLLILGGCGGCENRKTDSGSFRGASSYTPYDAHSMLWTREEKGREMVWVSSGGEAGNLLVSDADPGKRPDWILCTQGVVAGLAAKGERVVVLATVYISEDSIVPVFRKPKRPLDGSQSLYIPRTSIELAFDRLLEREGVARDRVRVPNMEKVGFNTIAALLAKPADDRDALDFAVLVDPFVTNLIKEHPGQYEIGRGGLYEIHYSVVARQDEVKTRRAQFVELLRQLLAADDKLASLKDDDEFYREVWGRKQGDDPDYLPRMLTYRREPARVQLQLGRLRQHLRSEIEYLVQKHPEQLKMPEAIDSLVDPSLLEELAPDRVVRQP